MKPETLDQKNVRRAVVCPEQRTAVNGEGKADHCGNCGLCWAGDTPIVFVKH